MGTDIFLGEPPADIKQWIIDHATPAGHPETKFTLEDGTVETHDITGTLDLQWMIDNGYFDDYAADWTKTIIQADIGNTVTSLGICVFEGCKALTSVTIPDRLTSIEDSVFNGCSGLTNITIPNSVISIGGWVFCDCENLSSVIIGNSVTSIGECVFCDCTNLTSVTIGNSVTNIEKSAFEGCSKLTSVTFLGKTIAQVQAMANYSWGISNTSIINVT